MQFKLATLLSKWPRHERCGDVAAHLQTARENVDAALESYDSEHTPYFYEHTTRLRAAILAALEDRAGY